jgi:hypothetical protein
MEISVRGVRSSARNLAYFGVIPALTQSKIPSDWAQYLGEQGCASNRTSQESAKA